MKDVNFIFVYENFHLLDKLIKISFMKYACLPNSHWVHSYVNPILSSLVQTFGLPQVH